MYAVFRTGGKQYRAAKGDVLRLEKIEADEGATVTFDEVLLIGEGADVKVGDPLLSGSSVSGKVLSQGKTKKVNVVKFKRRQNYLRQGSHRQFYTEVEITGISGEPRKLRRKRRLQRRLLKTTGTDQWHIKRQAAVVRTAAIQRVNA
jgi:large subunit ribosomal protein L21